MPAQANRLGHLRHVLAANQTGANARQFAFAPFRMQSVQRLRHNKSQNRVAEKFKPLIIGCGALFAAFACAS